VYVAEHTRYTRLLTFNFAANDVSKGTYGIAKVRTTLAGGFTILTSTAFLHAGLMKSRREGRYVNLRPRRAPEDLSILSSILGISQEVSPHAAPSHVPGVEI
jgi:non-canonical poly(A) RNA polymerase PAPD5/7